MPARASWWVAPPNICFRRSDQSEAVEATTPIVKRRSLIFPPPPVPALPAPAYLLVAGALAGAARLYLRRKH